MTLERSHGKARPTLPRLRDVADLPPARDPRQGRDAKGRFTGGNPIGNGRGWRQLIARMAGRELEGEAAVLGKAAWTLYRALLAELPSQAPAVCVLVASQARSAVLAGRFATRATELGLDSDAGRAALEMSVRLDARAERSAVTALDLATKLAAAERLRAASANPILQRILDAGSEPREPQS